MGKSINKYIDLESLPKKFKNSNFIDWEKSIGMKVNFKYDDIVGYFKILNYKSLNQNITILFNNEKYNIHTSSVYKCKLGTIVGKFSRLKYKYKIGEIIETKSKCKIKILKQIMKKDTSFNCKAYEYICIIDNYIGTIFERDLVKGQGCPICTNKKVMVGVNDMWTTNPELAKLLLNPEDGYKYTQNSRKRLDWKCHNCGEIIKNKEIIVVNLQRLSCPKCSDGISYPEKVVYSVLCLFRNDCICQLNKINEKWIPGGIRYDFAFLNESCIIEVHGLQHYENGFKQSSLEEIIKNDKYKSELAIQNGIKNYIIIDARYSNINWIKQSIINSNLSDILNINFEYVDWNIIDEKCQKSAIKDVCNLWNSGVKSTQKIADMIKYLKKNTVIRYLKKGSKYGWCDYNPKIQTVNINGKKVKCITTNLIFNSIQEACKKYNIKTRDAISQCCKGKKLYAGKHPITKENLCWEFI